jgi:hypothetical protein
MPSRRGPGSRRSPQDVRRLNLRAACRKKNAAATICVRCPPGPTGECTCHPFSVQSIQILTTNTRRAQKGIRLRSVRRLSPRSWRLGGEFLAQNRSASIWPGSARPQPSLISKATCQEVRPPGIVQRHQNIRAVTLRGRGLTASQLSSSGRFRSALSPPPRSLAATSAARTTRRPSRPQGRPAGRKRRDRRAQIPRDSPRPAAARAND